MPALTPEQEALKAAALAATPGPWYTGSFDRNGVKPTVYATGNELRYVAQCADFLNVTPTPNEANARFIASANPAVILAILAQLESYIAEYEKVADRLAQLEAAQAVPDGWIDLIEWLLGKNGPFPTRNSTTEGLYWWRKELRARYEKLAGAAPGEPGQ